MADRVVITIEADSRGVTVGVQQANRQLDTLERHAARVSQRIRDVGEGVQSMGQVLGYGLTLPLVALGAASFKAAVEMDSLRRGLIAVSGSAGEAEKQLVRLREVAKLPGLGFKEAIEGSVALQAAGASAALAERSLMALGNALATVGKGRNELARVNEQLTQMIAKNKVQAQEIRIIAENIPQLRRAMIAAFGTADTEELQKRGLAATEFLSGVLTELEKLPRVTSGAKITIENFADAVFISLAKVGNALLQPVGIILEALTPAVERLADSFAALSPNTQMAIIAAAAFAAALGPLAIALGALVPVLLTVVNLGAPLLLTLGGLTAAAGLFVTAYAGNFLGLRDIVNAVFGAMSSLFSFLTNNTASVALLAVTFGALTAALIAYRAAAIAAAAAAIYAQFAQLLTVLGPAIAFIRAMIVAVQALAISLFQLGSVAAMTATELALATAGITLLLGLLATVIVSWYNASGAQQQYNEVTAEQIQKSQQQVDSYGRQIDFLKGLEGGTARTKQETDRYNAILGQLTGQQQLNVELAGRQAEASDRQRASTQALVDELDKLRVARGRELEIQVASAGAQGLRAIQTLDAERQKREQLVTVLERMRELRGQIAAAQARGEGVTLPVAELQNLQRTLYSLGQTDLGGVVGQLQQVTGTRNQIAALDGLTDKLTDTIVGLGKPIDDAAKSAAEMDARLRAAEQATGLNTRGVFELATRLGLFRGNIDEAVAAVARYRGEQVGAADDTNKTTEAVRKQIDVLRQQKAELEAPANLRRATVDLAVVQATQEAVRTGQKATDVFARMRRENGQLDADIKQSQAEETAARQINETLQIKGHTAKVARTKREQSETERLTDRIKKMTAEIEGFYDAGSQEFRLRYQAEDLERLRRDLEKILDLRRELTIPLDTPLPQARDAAAIRLTIEQLESMRRVQQQVVSAQHERLKADEALAEAILTQGLPIADAETVAQTRLIELAEERRRKERDLAADLRVAVEERRRALGDEAEQLRLLRAVYDDFRVGALRDEAESREARLRSRLRLLVNLGREPEVQAQIRVQLDAAQEKTRPTVERISDNVGQILTVLRGWLERRDTAAGAGGLDVGARVEGAQAIGFGGASRHAFGAPRGDHRHGGADYHAARGSRLGAAGAGRVTFAGPSGDYGNLVVVQHEGGRETRYAHLDRVLTQVGAQLARGEALGTLGSTGRSSGAHLHYEVRVNGKAVDPAKVADLVPLLAGRRVDPAEQAPATQTRTLDLRLPGYAPFDPSAGFGGFGEATADAGGQVEEMTERITSLRAAVDTLNVIDLTSFNNAAAAADDQISDMVEAVRQLRHERAVEDDPARAEFEALRDQLSVTLALEQVDARRRREARAASTERAVLLRDYNAAVSRETAYVLRLLQESDDARLAGATTTQNNLIVLEDDYRRAVEREEVYVGQLRARHREQRLADMTETANRIITLEDDVADARVRSEQYVAEQQGRHREGRLSEERRVLDEIYQLELDLAEGTVAAADRRRLAQLKAVKDVRDADEEAIERQIRAQVQLADASVFHSERARAQVLEHLAKQKTVTDAVAESFINLYDRALKPIDAAIDRMTKGMGLFGEVANGVLKSIARQLLSRVVSRFLDAVLPPTDDRTASGAGEGALREVFGGGGGGDRQGQARDVRQMQVQAQTVVVNGAQVVMPTTPGATSLLQPVVLPVVGGAAGGRGGAAGGGGILQTVTGFLGRLFGGGQGSAGGGGTPPFVPDGITYDGGTTGATRPRRVTPPTTATGGQGQAGQGLLDRLGLGGLRDLFKQRDAAGAITGGPIFSTGGGAGGFGFGTSGFASMLPMLGLSLGGQYGGILGAAGGLLGSIGLISPGAVGLSATSFLAPLFSNPITAVIGGALLVGGILLKRNQQRRADERTRTDILLQSKEQLNEVIRAVNANRIDPDEAMSRAQEIRASYLDAVGQLKDKKTRNIAIATVRELDYLIDNVLKPAVEAQRLRADRVAQFSPTFQDGGRVASRVPRLRTGGRSDSLLDLLPGYGLVPGYYDAYDSHIIAVTGREVVLSPRDQAALGLTPSKFRRAGVRGFSDGGKSTPKAGPPAAAGGDGAAARPVFIIAIGDAQIAELAKRFPGAVFVNALSDDVKRNGPSGALGVIVDGLETYFS